MFQSLRFRLSAIFLAAVLVAGLVSSLIALRLFQDYTQSQTLKELRRESIGITQFYAEQAGINTFSAKNLEKATGDRLFYIPVYGLALLPGAKVELPPVPAGAVTRTPSLAPERSAASSSRLPARRSATSPSRSRSSSASRPSARWWSPSRRRRSTRASTRC